MTRSAKRWLLLVGCSWLCKSYKQVCTAEVYSYLHACPLHVKGCQSVPCLGKGNAPTFPRAAGMQDASVARPLCSLLRQLASNDSNKALLVEAGGLELLASLLAAQGSNPAVLEQALGLLTNLTLRNPEAASKVWCGSAVRCTGFRC